MSLSPSFDSSRYNRQIRLKEVGVDGQRKLASSSVLVVGAGGLGCPVLQYLAGAGIGRIGIADGDLVELHNLHRQPLYRTDDVGSFKAEAAATAITELNPEIKVNSFSDFIRADNAIEIIQDYDLVVDGSDNFPTRYLVNDCCVLLQKPLVYGAVQAFEGQVSIFNVGHDGREYGPNYRDLFPLPPSENIAPRCEEAGILGVLPGIIGMLQANEALKYLLDIEGLLDGKLLLYDAKTCDTRTLQIKSHASNPLSTMTLGNIKTLDYEDFCYPDRNQIEVDIDSILQFRKNEFDFVLVDVRMPEEITYHAQDVINIPLDKLNSRMSELPTEVPVVFYCESGARSRDAARTFNEKYGGGKAFSLKGGASQLDRYFDRE